MPLPTKLLPWVATPNFWARWFWDEKIPEVEFGVDRLSIEFARSGPYALQLDILEHLDELTLSLIHPERPTGEQIAWDDQAHWHPYVLRWEELDLVCRAAAKQDPRLPHPGLPLLLLCRFAPICKGDDPEVVVPPLFEAWKSLGILKDETIQEYIEFVDHRQDGFAWTQGSSGWSLGRDPAKEAEAVADPYTLRTSENPEFPNQPLEAYLNLLRVLVGAAEKAPKRDSIPELRLRYQVHVNVPEPEEKPTRGRRVAEALDSALKSEHRGDAHVSGGESTEIRPGVDRWTDTFITVTLRGDLERAIDVIRRTLRAMKAPRDVTVELRKPKQRPIPWWE